MARIGRSLLGLLMALAIVTLSPVAAFAAAPVANDGADSTSMNTQLPVFLDASDADGDILAFSIVGSPSHGTLDDCSSGECTYTPATDYIGTDSFTWKASDGTSFSNVATFSIAVTDPSAPVAYDNSTTAAADDTTPITISGESPDGHDLTFAITQAPAHGTLGTIGAPDCSSGFCSATVPFTAAAGYLGDDQFKFTVSDGTKVSVPGTITLTVATAPCHGATVSNGTVELGVNCTGDLNLDGIGVHFLATNNDGTSAGCPCEGWGAADETTAVTGYANESSGTSSNLSVLSFTHDADSATSKVAIGSTLEVTHDYQPSDKTPNAYKVTVTIKNVSADPVHLRYRRSMDWDIEPTAFSEYVTNDPGNASEIVFDSDNGFATSDPLAGPSQINETGKFTDSGPTDHGALFDFDFGTLAAGATKTFDTYYGAAATEVDAKNALAAVGAEAYSLGEPSTPDGPTLGTPNTFLFGFGSVGGTALFAPDAVDDVLSTSMNTANGVNVLANDTDPDGDTLTVTTATPTASHGTVSCASTGLCTYTPTTGYTGADSFTYSISDGNGGTDTATVSVTVTGAATNHAPDAVDDSATTPEDTAKAISVLTNDTDVDSDTLTVTTPSPTASHGTVACTSTVCTYTPAANYNGPDSFTYGVSDGHGGTDTATVSITVTAVNDAPDAVNDSATTPQDTAKAISVLTNDTDVDGDTLTVTTSSPTASHGTVSCTTTVCTYTPSPGYSGSDSFTYGISDGHGGTDTATVSLTVTPVAVPAAVNLAITKTALAPSVAVGELTGYQIVVRNNGTAASPPFTVDDPLPSGFRFKDSSSPACTLTNAFKCTFGPLAAGASVTVTVNGAFVTHGVIANTASIIVLGDSTPGDNSSTAQTTVNGLDCTIVGTFGNDHLNGTNRADVICGLSGDDQVNAKQGNDTVYGNEGDDRLMGLGGNDYLDGGPGTDTVLYSGLRQSVRVNLGQHKATGQGVDTLVSIENATGSAKDDVLLGDAGSNVLSGLGGNDKINGAAGDDVLVGGSGKDKCSQGSGKGPKSSC